MNLANLRNEYSLQKLDEKDVQLNPVAQFKIWFNEALKAEVIEPNAMNLATVKPDGTPSTRIVLLKGVEQERFVFFSNYGSHKAGQLNNNHQAAILFFWPELQRQVRIEGTVGKIPTEQSDEYFASRPRGSQIGAHVSPQSHVIPNRAFLDEMVLKYTNQFEGKNVPRPENWGGYALTPFRFEFWQGRENRLHDRIQYRLLPSNQWLIERLSP